MLALKTNIANGRGIDCMAIVIVSRNQHTLGETDAGHRNRGKLWSVGCCLSNSHHQDVCHAFVLGWKAPN